MNIFALIPAYNEIDTIENVLRRILALTAIPLQIIVVDDGSTDGTTQIIESIHQKHPSRLRLMRNEKNIGYGETVHCAIAQVPKEDAFVVISADNCDEVELLPAMFALLQQGADIVCASRYMRGGQRRGGNLLKSLASRGYNFLLSTLVACPTKDLSNSYKLIRKNVLRNIPFTSAAFELFMEIILRAQHQGHSITEIPTLWRERNAGRSKFRIYMHGRNYTRWLGVALGCFLKRTLFSNKQISHENVF